MNKLVEYLNKYHNPGGNSVNTVLVEDLIFEMELTREEIFELATDPEVKKMISPRFNVKDWSKWRGNIAEERWLIVLVELVKILNKIGDPDFDPEVTETLRRSINERMYFLESLPWEKIGSFT